jgi:hypothetical protein
MNVIEILNDGMIIENIAQLDFINKNIIVQNIKHIQFLNQNVNQIENGEKQNFYIVKKNDINNDMNKHDVLFVFHKI